ncbi:uncharacterized protein LOC119092450 [Pollicipes pollicipes]|uniref:uncharacterized protein LOC119092450 n=1 Tax=Pollicipes pollicipes TaxID=41117 RepID=UPI001884BAA2|nr:uncharacterized protein LOC119092450 [Pollicipes pollicipes]
MEPSRSALPQRVAALVTDQNETLLRALRLPNVRVVVYATHSANRAENEEVVFGVVDEVNEQQRRRWQAARDHSKLETETPPDKLFEFRQLVTIPDENNEDIGIPFLVLPQTSTSSGVFISVIVKNMDFIQREHRSVIDDAFGMGMLDKVGGPAPATEPAESRPSRRKLRRPRAAVRSDRLIVVGKKEPPPAAAAAATTVPLHVHVPHLQDCTCTDATGQRGAPELERARQHERDAVGRLTQAADKTSREAIRAIQEQMEGAWGAARRERDADTATMRDLEDLERTRLGDDEASQGDAARCSLPRLPPRTRHLSLGPPLRIHKVNIGEMLPLALQAPPVF